MTAEQTLTLRDLVDQLTRPHNTPVYLHGEYLRNRPDPALLTALADARTANIGAGNGGTAAHERVTLNLAASELYATIQKRIRAWAIRADIPRHWQLTGTNPIDWTNATELLRAWHTRTLGRALFDETPYADTLHGWIRQITDMIIDPPRRWTLNSACPLCDTRYVIDLDGHQIDALAVIERDPAHQTITICRHCEAIWRGIDGARQLRIAIDDQGAA